MFLWFRVSLFCFTKSGFRVLAIRGLEFRVSGSRPSNALSFNS